MSNEILLVRRGAEGLIIHNYQDNELNRVASDVSGACRVFTFSPNGKLIAFCNSKIVKLRNLTTKTVDELPHAKAFALKFSSCGNVLAIWEQYAHTKENPTGAPNLHLYSTKSGAVTLLKSLYQKKFDHWCPQWSVDEFLCARAVTNEVQFYARNDFGALDTKLCQQGVTQFALAQDTSNSSNPDAPKVYNVAVFIPGTKGQPCSARVFRYPDFGGQSIIMNKSFYRADTVTLTWNNCGSDLLVQTATEVAADSYYGEQGLYFLSARRGGEAMMVPLQKKGPVYQIEWSPDGTEFLVTHGFMPAKVTVYNLKCEPVFDFGTGPRNAAHFNPQGNILCLAGFGNLRGDCEFWDFKQKKLLSRIRLPDCTQFEWCPDGEHVLSCTCAPRLRVNNGLRIVHYTGPAGAVVLPAEGELWEARFQPQLPLLPAPRPRHGEKEAQEMCKMSKPGEAPAPAPTPAANGAAPAPKSGGYVPPHLRGRPGAAPARLLEKEAEYHAASNQRNDAAASGVPLSKAAMKNKKRKEAKQAATARVESATSGGDGAGAGGEGVSWMSKFVESDDLDQDKKVKGLLRKMDQIEKLKSQQAEGKQLELNQIEKLKTEKSLTDELAAMNIF